MNSFNPVSNPLSFKSKLAKFKKYLKPAGLILAGLLLVFVTKRLVFPARSQTNSFTPASPSGKTLNIDNGFEIPVGQPQETEDGEEIPAEAISFQITSAELTGDIILKGQKASAVNGKEFLILNVKLTNPMQKRIKLDTRDYVRLSLVDSPDRLAPQIHNDPVELQPISDQYTRIGFSVPAGNRDFKLYVGQITSGKTEIDLNFK